MFNFCSSLCSLDTKPLSETLLVEVFSLPVFCPVYSVYSFFCCARLLISYNSIVRSWGCFQHCWSSIQKSVVYTYVKCFRVFSFSSFGVSSFKLRSSSWFELIVWRLRGMDLISLFYTCIPSFASTMSWKDESTDILFEMCFYEGDWEMEVWLELVTVVRKKLLV